MKSIMAADQHVRGALEGFGPLHTTISGRKYGSEGSEYTERRTVRSSL
jgi:hypothetical protein